MGRGGQNRTHGHAAGGQSREYRAWYAMKKRCTNPASAFYSRYGGRGITFDPRWSRFDVFLSDLGLCPSGCSLDRINNDGHYEPDNVRWGTDEQQANNRSNNKRMEFGGEWRTLAEWARHAGMTYRCMARDSKNAIRRRSVVAQ